MSLPKFDIYEGARAKYCFKSHINSWYPHFFQEKVLSDVWYEIHLVWRNIPSTGRSLWAKKHIYLDLRQSHEFNKNEQMQIVFTMEELLEVAIESWSEWDLNL